MIFALDLLMNDYEITYCHQMLMFDICFEMKSIMIIFIVSMIVGIYIFYSLDDIYTNINLCCISMSSDVF